jgi:hypothetical protein
MALVLIDNLISSDISLTKSSSGGNWIDAIVHDIKYFDENSLDKGLVWGLIKRDDIDKFERYYFLIGSEYKEVREQMVTDDDIISRKWIKYGKYAISPVAFSILNFYNKRLCLENVLIYKSIYDDICDKHRYYDIKKIKITKNVIKCNVCKKLSDSYERKPFFYYKGIDYNNICKCKIINNESITCPLCNNKEGIQMFRNKMHFGKYKGKYVIDIMKNDMSYIIWICENMKKKTKYINEICNKILIKKNYIL